MHRRTVLGLAGTTATASVAGHSSFDGYGSRPTASLPGISRSASRRRRPVRL
ncbi:hypothetical protein [Natronomonas marina]|uniref:hypothetical protein n=1 Tax=Natronomonas marina TaxID=2961939 RepID=UPI0020C98839|nr:hypothetical protein [Natronomonas marina]